MNSGFHWYWLVLGLLFFVLIGGIGWKIVQRTESTVNKAGSFPSNTETKNFGFLVFQPGCQTTKAQLLRELNK